MAGRIPPSFIDELMARVDIVEVIDARVPLKKAGREFTACCPFHHEKTPSFTVSPAKQFYHCFGCGAHGTAIGFLMDYEHLEFVEAVEELAAQVGLEVPREPAPGAGRAAAAPSHDELYSALADCDAFFRRQLRRHPQGPRAIEYLRGRGLSGEVVADFGIGYAPPGWDNLARALAGDAARRTLLIDSGMLVAKGGGGCYDRFRDRIMFPIRDRRGRTIAFGGRVLGDETPKYLNSPETAVFHKGRELYGLFEARKALRAIPRLLIVEGYMDVVALAQFDIRYAVATLGTATTRDHLERIFRVAPEAVFCFDGDRAGREAAWRALENAIPVMHEGREVRFMFLPEGEDPDTRVRAIGREAFEAEIANAVPFSNFFFETLSKKTDTTSIDGRARLVALARPLLAKLPAGVFRHMMTARLAEIAGVAAAEIERSLGEARAPRALAGRARPPSAVKSPPSPVRRAVEALMRAPLLAEEAGDPRRFAGLGLPGLPLLIEMIEVLQANPHMTTGALLERWRDTEYGRHLAQLLRATPLLDEAGLDAEFHGALALLDRRMHEQRFEELRVRGQSAPLSPEETAEFGHLARLLGGGGR